MVDDTTSEGAPMGPDNAAKNENESAHASVHELPTSGSPAVRRRLWIGLAVLETVLVVALVLALVWRGSEGYPGASRPTDTAAAPSAPTSTDPPATSAPTKAPTAIAAPPGQSAAPGVPRPSTCTQLYSAAMVEALGDLALNPTWSRESNSGVTHGTDDAELRTQIDTLDHLTCVWASPYGGSETGITTNVVWVTPEQSVAVEARLVADGLECFDQSEGHRCVIQTNTVDGAYGESHFLRNGIWLATKYTNASPLGYTQNIIDNLWSSV
ncbi:MAG: hypothetical protein LH624_02765 [Cryobacterium sp.]|nr:hypothetical protein [Cryobacterium sp.]